MSNNEFRYAEQGLCPVYNVGCECYSSDCKAYGGNICHLFKDDYTTEELEWVEDYGNYVQPAIILCIDIETYSSLCEYLSGYSEYLNTYSGSIMQDKVNIQYVDSNETLNYIRNGYYNIPITIVARKNTPRNVIETCKRILPSCEVTYYDKNIHYKLEAKYFRHA